MRMYDIRKRYVGGFGPYYVYSCYAGRSTVQLNPDAMKVNIHSAFLGVILTPERPR